MKKVIACGQFTTCAKLLEYSLEIELKMKREASLPAAERTILFSDEDLNIFNVVKKQLEDDWKQFKLQPDFLV